MNYQIVLVLLFNLIISIIGTLAYSIRIVGIRTGKIALSYSLFNILILISRTAVTFQIPLLTKYLEQNLIQSSLEPIFYSILLCSFIATIIGAFLIPSFQRIFSKMVNSFSNNRSMIKLLLHIFSKNGIKSISENVTIPVKENITKMKVKDISLKVFIFNIVAVSLFTVGSIAPIFAGSIEPDLRATCITLSAVINGLATILLTLFIDPYLSVMTDDVVQGKCSESKYRTNVVGMVGARIIGSFVSIFLLIPAAYLIVSIARII
jgi:hypothetical protein